MTKVAKKSTREKMHSHLDTNEAIVKKSFTIIDEWLPREYVSLVQEKVKASEGVIRNVKYNRKGSAKIIKAMVEVALENKAFFNSLENS
ncbi:hypothetical protein ACPDHJ_05785 [Myroides sp. C8-3]|uniref:hypothetical protein n=1 Tax=Myroides sp. C8-3 TaxID=3400533 RepID=UPI003D2F7030